MHIFSLKDINVPAVIVSMLVCTWIIFGLFVNDVHAVHLDYYGTVTFEESATDDSGVLASETISVSGDDDVLFELIDLEQSNYPSLTSIKIRVEGTDSDSDNELITINDLTEGQTHQVDGEEVELNAWDTTTGQGDMYVVTFSVVDPDGGDGGQCAPDETLEKEWTKLGDYGSCGDYKNGDGCNVSDSNNGSTGWASDSVPDCGETETYITSDGCSIGGTGSDMENCIFGGGTEQRTQQCNCVGGNDPPTADDDGTVDAGICADSDGLIIDVLDNDDDPDNDPLSIDSVGIPSNGTTVIIDDNGTDKILYTPSSAPDTVTFDYTISDGNGGTDTATVTVAVNGTTGSCEGSITVEVEDKDGNPVGAESIQVEYDGDVKDLGSGSSASTTVGLKDSGADAVIQQSDIDPPEGYKVKEGNWVDKDEAEETYQVDWKSELGF